MRLFSGLIQNELLSLDFDFDYVLLLSNFGKAGSPHFNYFNYCAAVSETEVDVLTGQFVVKRVDILYDCGQRSILIAMVFFLFHRLYYVCFKQELLCSASNVI